MIYRSLFGLCEVTWWLKKHILCSVNHTPIFCLSTEVKFSIWWISTQISVKLAVFTSCVPRRKAILAIMLILNHSNLSLCVSVYLTHVQQAGIFLPLQAAAAHSISSRLSPTFLRWMIHLTWSIKWSMVGQHLHKPPSCLMIQSNKLATSFNKLSSWLAFIDVKSHVRSLSPAHGAGRRFLRVCTQKMWHTEWLIKRHVLSPLPRCCNQPKNWKYQVRLSHPERVFLWGISFEDLKRKGLNIQNVFWCRLHCTQLLIVDSWPDPPTYIFSIW